MLPEAAALVLRSISITEALLMPVKAAMGMLTFCQLPVTPPAR